jgi:hypothetical protein
MGRVAVKMLCNVTCHKTSCAVWPAGGLCIIDSAALPHKPHQDGSRIVHDMSPAIAQLGRRCQGGAQQFGLRSRVGTHWPSLGSLFLTKMALRSVGFRIGSARIPEESFYGGILHDRGQNLSAIDLGRLRSGQGA